MANTGFKHLRYTGELNSEHGEARKFAVHATALLDSASHCPSLDSLLQDLDVVYGFSPRNPWDDAHGLDLDDFHQHVQESLDQGRSLGLLFGNEARGLTNDQLARCTRRVCLPTHSEYTSMNLSHAVTVVLWELIRQQPGQPPSALGEGHLASHQEVEILLKNLHRCLEIHDIFNPQNPDHLWRELMPIFRSRTWSPRETNLLNAIFGKCASRHQALLKQLSKPRAAAHLPKQDPPASKVDSHPTTLENQTGNQELE